MLLPGSPVLSNCCPQKKNYENIMAHNKATPFHLFCTRPLLYCKPACSSMTTWSGRRGLKPPDAEDEGV